MRLPSLFWIFISMVWRAQGMVPLEDFYPFGTKEGDTVTRRQDDGGSGLLPISKAFTFFGDKHSGLYVNNNGVVSFLREVSQFTPVAFPISGDRRVVAAFWADVDNRRGGNVFYRETEDLVIVDRATRDVRTYFPELPDFHSTWVFIATWHRVTFYGGDSTSPVNTFQIVLITDGLRSFTIFNYETIEWTTGRHASSGGDSSGRGGIAAQAGFNAGDGWRYFNIPGSRTDDIARIANTTNVGVPGRWVFRIDNNHVQVGECRNATSVCWTLRPCQNGGRCIDDCVTGNPSYTCSCLSGFTGKHCHIDMGKCYSQPCQNDGTCVDEPGSFTCLCTSDFTGTLCETEVSPCTYMTCHNGGECEDHNGIAVCVCQRGYTGDNCDTELLPCSSSPCLNGGSCENIDAGFRCQCALGFTGTHCEKEPSACFSSPCMNNGVCKDVGAGYICVCVQGFTGMYCETEIRPCSSAPCLNRGVCRENGETYSCQCARRFTGKHCETEIRPCFSNPCMNMGTCEDMSEGYSCICTEGYTGIHCETELRPCYSSPCLNGALCKDFGITYSCVCAWGFTGARCETELHPCFSSPCLNGATCRDVGFAYSCQCAQGFTGMHCETEIKPCFSSPCLNGGTCEDLAISFACLCAERYTGLHCETEIQPCFSSPCLNRGICNNEGAFYSCTCAEGFTGENCEKEVSPCLSSPCLNGATCIDMGASYSCMCPQAFTGALCDTEIPSPCTSNPCENKGVCREAEGGYLCDCPAGFSGMHCEHRVSDDCPCRNGGRCADGNSTCHCPPGHFGLLCEYEVTSLPCSMGSQCPDGGSCMEYGGSYLCVCHTDYILSNHSIPSPCDSDPCLNGGTCESLDDAYTCACPRGFNGRLCEKVKPALCSLSPCRNGGTCKESREEYYCVCPYPFTGKHCETGMRGPCSSGPCNNGGTCFHYLGKYKCDCPPNFSGRHCEKAELDCGAPEQVKYAKMIVTSTLPGGRAEYHCNEGYVLSTPNNTSVCSEEGTWSLPPECEEIDECASHPCHNGASCKDRISHFICECQKGYSGKYCEQETNECLSQPCKNGGTCQDLPGTFKCICPEGFTGSYCETEVDGCDSSPCQNGGLCENLAGSYLCVCPRGFFGYHCQTVSDMCLLNPCGNRGVCVSSADGLMSCTCRTGYTGTMCEKELLPPLSLSLGAVGENSVWVFWTPPEDGTGHVLDGFAVSYTAPDGLSRTDFVERAHTEHELRGLSPGRSYNITIVTVKRNLRHNDISRPLYLTARTRPPNVDRPRINSVMDTSVSVSWSLSPHRHTSIARVRLFLQHPTEPPQQAEQEPSAGEYIFRDLRPGEKYSVQISTLSRSDPSHPATESLPSAPLIAWTRPHPPSNLTAALVTANSVHLIWEQPPHGSVDGYIFNVTNNHSTKSRYVPSGKMTSYTVRDLQAGQRYRITVTALRNTPQGPVNSEPKTVRPQTLQREGPQERRWTPPRILRNRPPPQPHQEVRLLTERGPPPADTPQPHRFTELNDGRRRISARFSHRTNKAINVTKEPDPPVKIESSDEAAIPVRQALQLQDPEQRSKEGERLGCLETPCLNGGTCVNGDTCDCPLGFKGQQCQLACRKETFSCTRLISETTSHPVWEGGICHHLYRRVYKVQNDVCSREVCEGTSRSRASEWTLLVTITESRIPSKP
ncbi:sushi, nidogen and EGF-like domain-containing protein 1 isoform X1 [Xenopus tropicalis]|uniref:Sushi, nidogen and EGF-like domain-containing protein 1 isoform X1 n=1 Tax=Xenopus tropicalis TaxID=8364 RepID=A0A8J0SNU4_XENTR|nr:sushi, nidogen and EGF-like domain-containing protein 1 isoform X1 [Xenopus tropicalis]|eukprot:XP_012826283.1 PREDICTED: sushi, nidogen and EGF-like domain-containing protein 1 isoform X1 [Xenopus tropicalis]